LIPKVETQNCTVCVEDWHCSYTTCVTGDTVSYAYDCYDSNNCGTTKLKPVSKECALKKFK
jgi:hypothetical protein